VPIVKTFSRHTLQTDINISKIINSSDYIYITCEKIYCEESLETNTF